jgi:hypothetical protein
MRRIPTADSVARCLALAALLAFGAWGEVHGQGTSLPSASVVAETSDEGALFLLLPNGAQGVGVGRAMTSLASSESAFWNPAGLVDLDGSRIVLTRGEHLAGDATGVSAVLVGEGSHALGFSYQLLDGGTQADTDQDGNVLGSITIRNHQALLSAAAGIGTRLRVGANAKIVRFRITCRGVCSEGTPNVTATGYALDLGVQGRPLRDHPLRLGFMLAHLGPDFRDRDADQADPLPARVRAGASYDVLHGFVEEDLQVNVVVEVEDRLRNPGNASVYFGGEFIAGAVDRVFVRGGYILGDRSEMDGAALGFGVRYDRFEFGFARSLARSGPTSDDEPVHLTLGLVL